MLQVIAEEKLVTSKNILKNIKNQCKIKKLYFLNFIDALMIKNMDLKGKNFLYIQEL